MSDKVVLVTGAAQRIGSQIVREFHAGGFNIVLHFNKSKVAASELAEELNASRSDSVRTLQHDLVRNTNWDRIHDFCLDQWGRIDVVVNNASSFYPTPMGNIAVSQWEDLVGSNLRAPLFLSQALAPALKEVAGNIINVIDIHGDRPLKGYTVYSVAKAGLAMLTRSLAKELAPDIRVNGIAPGAILWPENEAEIDEGTKATIIRQIPLKRQGAPQDISQTAFFLATKAPYINGQIISVDGGRSLS